MNKQAPVHGLKKKGGGGGGGGGGFKEKKRGIDVKQKHKLRQPLQKTNKTKQNKNQTITKVTVGIMNMF